MKSSLMRKYQGVLILMWLTLILTTGCTDKPSETPTAEPAYTPGEVYVNMDSREAALPRKFRMCTDDIKTTVGDKAVSMEGLKELDMSGSGQFSEEGLKLVQSEIGKENIIIVDTRQESHGFINGVALSYMDELNKANKGKTAEQVEEDQSERLEAVRQQGYIIFPTDGDSRENAGEVYSEEELAESLGMEYIRFPVTNNEYPADDVVDEFVGFARDLPEGTWLHFHCMEGVGRTTMFMFMYDAMSNAKAVDIEDIMNRQVLLGGKNLLKSGSSDRAEFLKSFYQYCKENNDGYKTLWSDWKKK